MRILDYDDVKRLKEKAEKSEEAYISVSCFMLLKFFQEIERLDKEADKLATFCTDLCPNVPYHVNCQSCDNCPGMDCKNSDKPESWRELAKKMVEDTNG